MSRDIFQARPDSRNDMTETLAMSRNQMSQDLGKRKTASEAMIINQYTELRSDERRDIIADFLERSVQDIDRLVFKYWDTPDIIELIGEEGKEWATWAGEDLEGKYGIQIIPNSVMPHTKEMYRQKVEHLYSILMGNPFVNMKEMTRILLDSHEEFDTNKILLQQPGIPGDGTSMADFRPGQPKLQDDSKPEGQIAMPGNPEAAMAQGQRELG